MKRDHVRLARINSSRRNVRWRKIHIWSNCGGKVQSKMKLARARSFVRSLHLRHILLPKLNLTTNSPRAFERFVSFETLRPRQRGCIEPRWHTLLIRDGKVSSSLVWDWYSLRGTSKGKSQAGWARTSVCKLTRMPLSAKSHRLCTAGSWPRLVSYSETELAPRFKGWSRGTSRGLF